MRYGILGSLSVTDGSRDIAVTAGRDRVVLAMLLLHPGRIVGVDQLIDAVWEDDPPTTARGQLQTCVSRLRRALPPGAILTDPAGYGIRIGRDDLDAAVFTRLTAAARAVTGPDRSREYFRQALDLWRGAALVGIDNRAVRQAAGVLDEQRAVATEDWVDLELSGGRDRDLLAELTGLVERFPLRERLRAQLMLALYRVGRQADALAEYRRARDLFANELGIEPGAALRTMHQRILTGDIAVPAAVLPPTAALASGMVRCLPRTVGDFTGRDAVVTRLLGTIERSDPAGPAVVVIDGMAGSGKTTVALHLATLLGDKYPDAHLFVDLHGHSDREPVAPAAALLTLLRELGVPADRIPADPAERVILWRTELAARHALVIFDNAASSAQLADLLPTSAGSLALVTGRRRLLGLDGVHPESLPLLHEAEGVALLRRIAGDRVEAEPEAAAEVVRRCGLLPLAVRLAGSRLAHRPRWRVADLVRRLGESALPELAAEDRTVASAFALSYGQLAERAQRLFRLLGVHPGRTFDTLSVAALADLPLDEAEDLLDDLVDVHLVDEPASGVFRLHDLLREYAVALADEIPAPDRAAAVTALLDFQLHAFVATTAPQARGTLARDLRGARPLRPELIAALGDPGGHLERTRPDIGAFMDAAVAVGRPEYAWLLPRAAWRRLWARGYTDDIATLHRRALEVAEASGDDVAVAFSANYLASAITQSGRYDEALELLGMAATRWERAGNAGGVASALGNSAYVYEFMGRIADSLDASMRALPILRRLGDHLDIELRLNAVAFAHTFLGQYEAALRHHRLRLALVIEAGDRTGIAHCFVNIAMLKRRAGRAGAEASRRMLRVAMRLPWSDRYPSGLSEARNELALIDRAEGNYPAAIAGHREALDMARGIRYRRHEVMFMNDLGDTFRAAGDTAEALEHYTVALATAREVFSIYDEARALNGIAGCIAADDPAGARRRWLRALEIFQRMGVPERLDVEKHLADL
jgi:DNA-binding SARP family transcriptional activator/tetratricopeptide (TPR) repeat protein